MRRFALVIAMLVVPGMALVAHAAEPVKLEYWSWDQNIHDIEVNEVVKPFMKANPGVEVEVLTEPWAAGGYWDKLITLNATGNPPDVYNMSVAYAWDYANQNLVMNMEPFARSLDQGSYFWPIMDDLRWPNRKGDLYAFPFAWVASALYFNKGLFDNAGASYPNQGWDWFMLRDVAKKLTKDVNGDGRPEQYGFVTNSGHELLDSVIYSWGGAVLDPAGRRCMLTEPRSIEAIQFMVDLMYQYQVAPPTSVGGFGLTAGNTAMQVAGSYAIESWRVAAKGIDWDIAMVPKGPKGRVVYGGPDSIVVSRFTKHPKEAWEFVKYLIGSTRTIASFMGGKVPIYVPLAMSNAWQESNKAPAHKQVIIESAQYIRGADFGTTKWMEWRVNDMNAALAPAFNNTMSVENAVVDAAARINAILGSVEVRK